VLISTAISSVVFIRHHWKLSRSIQASSKSHTD